MILSAFFELSRSDQFPVDAERSPWPRLDRADRYFGRLTAGRPVVCGRNTWQRSQSRLPFTMPLEGRGNFVLSRDRGWYPEYTGSDTTSVDKIGEPAEFIDHCEQWGGDEAFVLGGLKTIESFWPWIGRVYLIRVNTILHEDAADYSVFPSGGLAGWRYAPLELRPASDRNATPGYQLVRYDRPYPPLPIGVPRETDG